MALNILCGVLLLLQSAAPSAAPAPAEAAAQAAETAAAPAPAVAAPILKRDTPVTLLATREINSQMVAGTQFRLRVNQPVLVGGATVIPVGAWAYGEIRESRDAGGLGKSGRMSIALTHIEYNGLRIPLSGEFSSKGEGAGSAGLAVVFAGVTGLFHRGNNAKVKAGEVLTGFVAEDVPLPAPVAQ